MKRAKLRVACSNCEKQIIICLCKEAATNCHLSVKGAIAYQKVQAKVNIPENPEVKCRMFLDTGCDRTLGGKPIGFERKIFGTVHEDKIHRCASKLTSIRNERPKILKEGYRHLKDLEFSDVSDKEELDVHLILGLEDLCKLRTGKMVWGEPGESVAEQTRLG